jgi:hypothetical protein
MANRTKVIISGIVLFLLGGVLGALAGASGARHVYMRGLEPNMYMGLENDFLRVADADGTPKSPEAIADYAKRILTMDIINTGMLYPRFRDKGIRDGVMKYFKYIDANRAALQAGNDQQMAEADRVRACVIKFANDNKGATECLNACSRINYEIGDSQTGKITKSVACKP